ncbi:MAG: ATPase [Rhodospirillales bacterium]|nr:ATPase [Rhodospirillales bacterium]
MTRKAKRFYKAAAVEPGEGGFRVALDGRPVRTPGGASLRVPTASLAEAIRREWDGQGDVILPATMPMTQLACTAADRIEPHRQEIVERLAAFAATDLVCYRAADSAALAERQETHWRPILDWVAQRHGATFTVTTGVMPVAQPASALRAVKEAVRALDTPALTVLSCVTAAAGSILIGLALVGHRISAEQAFMASQADEAYQIERWGADGEADARRKSLRAEIETAAAYLALSRS